MKKVLLAVLCAGLFFACGKKKQVEQPETLIDTPVVEEVVQEVEEVVAEPVAEEPVAQTQTTTKKPAAKKTSTPTKAEQQGIQKVDDNSTARKQADQPAAAPAQTQQQDPGVVNSGKKKR